MVFFDVLCVLSGLISRKEDQTLKQRVGNKQTRSDASVFENQITFW